MLSHTYDYRSNLEASQRVNWKLEDVIGGRTLDFGRPFLPESLAGVNGIRCLSDGEKLKLNQIRGFTYLYLFGLVEEYILPAVIEHAEGSAHGDDYEMRALLRFAEEEAKHIQLFKWFVKEFESGFGTPCGAIGPAKIEAGIDDYMDIGKLLDGGLQTQVRMDVESLQTATGRVFTPAEREEIEREQVRSYRWTFLLSGMTHPNFDRSLRELSVDGHRRVGELARAIG